MKNEFASLPKEKQAEIEKLLDDLEAGEQPETSSEQENIRLYTFDDTGNAQRFFDMFGGGIVYNHTDKMWLYWDGKRWHADLDKEAYRRAALSIEKMRDELEFYQKTDEENGTKNAENFAKHIKYTRSMKCEKALVEMPQQ